MLNMLICDADSWIFIHRRHVAVKGYVVHIAYSIIKTKKMFEGASSLLSNINVYMSMPSDIVINGPIFINEIMFSSLKNSAIKYNK